MSSQQRLHNPNLIFDPNAYWPIVTYGECTRRQQHKPYCKVDWLGDGICVKCWDTGYTSQREKAYTIMTSTKNHLIKNPNSDKWQAKYEEAKQVWQEITKDEDPKMKFGGLFDFE